MSVKKSHYESKIFGFGAWLLMLCLWVTGVATPRRPRSDISESTRALRRAMVRRS